MSTTLAIAPRRTQEARRASTRRALLDATVATLVDDGYAGTTTTVVCKRAGVSQGALFKHFPTKAALLAAAVEDLFPRLLDGVRERAGSLPTFGPARAIAIVDLLFDEYARPELQAAVELYGAARCDADLAAALAAVEPPHRSRLHAVAADLLPEVAHLDGFDGVVDLVVDAVQGAVTGRLGVLEPDAARAARDRLRTSAATVLVVLMRQAA